MKKVLIAIALIIGIGLVPGTASAHHPLVSGTATCVADGSWSVNWVVSPDRNRQDVTWQIVSPTGYSPAGSQVGDQSFTRVLTYPESQAVAWQVVTAVWSDGSGGRRAGSVTRPADCTDPVPTDPVPTDPVPTDPVPTDPVPTDPVPTDPVPTDPVPTDPVPTDPVPTDPTPAPTDPVPTDPTPAPTDPVPTDPTPAPSDPTATDPTPAPSDPTATNPGGGTPTDGTPTDGTPTDGTPTNGTPTGDLPSTGSDATANLLTAAIVLIIIGGLTWVRSVGQAVPAARFLISGR